MKVLVINQCSTNKGDRAVLYFLLGQLKAAGIKDVTVSASNPEYWLEKPDFPDIKIKIVPWGWDISRSKNAGLIEKVIHRIIKVMLPSCVYFALVRKALNNGKRPWFLKYIVNKEFFNALENSELVISTGGHHLTTIIAGSIKTPQIFDMAVTLLLERPLLLWSQSVGSFDFKSPSSKSMIQKILQGARQIYIRDKASEQDIENLGVSTEHVVKTRESVFGLYDAVEERIPPDGRENILGISVWTGNKQNPQAWEHYIRNFAGLVKHAIDKGYRVRFFPMEMQGSDRKCIEDIIKHTNNKDKCEIFEHFPGTVEHINAIARCKIFAGHKTHSQIFSLVAATPLIAVAYHKKTEDFMAQFGLEKYCITDIQLNADKMIEISDAVNNNLDWINRQQQKIAHRMYMQVKADFNQMLEGIQTDKIKPGKLERISL